MTEPTRSRPPRPPQANAGRGVALVLVAVLIGGLLIWKNPGTGQVTTSPDLHSATSTTAEGGDEPDDTTTTTAAPDTTAVAQEELTITVANASGVGGAAGNISDKLKAAGYVQVAALNGNQGQPTKVFFDGDTQADAVAVATAIGLPESTVEARPSEVAIEDAGKTAQVIVILGEGFDPDNPGAGAADAGASTTAAVATTAAG
ncbi:MAG: LytR C-terminal domain-containing protein [Microthrixaceae bacterium]|nr:LytR C-terminal domain-containing protein [Microthrixaceae bacterium]